MHKRNMSAKNNQSDLNKYQKKTDKQHILDNPDTYIGSVELVESDEFIHHSSNDSTNDSIIKKTINIDGLLNNQLNLNWFRNSICFLLLIFLQFHRAILQYSGN